MRRSPAISLLVPDCLGTATTIGSSIQRLSDWRNPSPLGGYSRLSGSAVVRLLAGVSRRRAHVHWKLGRTVAGRNSKISGFMNDD